METEMRSWQIEEERCSRERERNMCISSLIGHNMACRGDWKKPVSLEPGWQSGTGEYGAGDRLCISLDSCHLFLCWLLLPQNSCCLVIPADCFLLSFGFFPFSCMGCLWLSHIQIIMLDYLIGSAGQHSVVLRARVFTPMNPGSST